MQGNSVTDPHGPERHVCAEADIQIQTVFYHLTVQLRGWGG